MFSVTVSLVSHSHGSMLWKLLDQLVVCPEVSKVIVTLNIPENYPISFHEKVQLIKNEAPKGFGSNHNAAFSLATSDLFCVINPDIVLIHNPFASLINTFADIRVGCVAPIVVGSTGLPEDSMRRFLSPLSMVRRLLGFNSGAYSIEHGASDFTPDWVAGMFILFRSSAYANVGGFDENYFMYCEDADVCTRLWKAGYKVVGCLSASVIHNAQRASHRSFKHLSWHLRSMARYFLSHSFSLPNKDAVIQRG